MTLSANPSSGRDSYDVIIVGAGVTGSEAAVACARAGREVLLVTTSLDTVYNLLGEGVTLTPPPDTLMAHVHAQLADEHGFVSNWEFHRRAKYHLEDQAGLHLLQSSVTGILLEADQVRGVSTWEGVDRRGQKLALCVGSFLKARLQIGQLTEAAGRLSEMAYDDLHDHLDELGFEFESITLDAHPRGGALPYQVHCRRFAAAEWDADTFRLPRLGGLYAAGVCAAGYLSFEQAAAAGRRLAQKLLAG